jgi:citrate lyase subunit beta/citryl-CoA lyase
MTMHPDSWPRRPDPEEAVSWLFVPGDRPDRIEKARRSAADAVIVDLEDAVPPAHKESARTHLSTVLDEDSHLVVRINGHDTPWFDEDLALVARHRCTVMVPKAEDVAIIDKIAQLADPAGLIALVETARGVEAVESIARAVGVVRLALGNVDLGAQLGVDPEDWDALFYSRSRLVVASAAAGLAGPVDGVTLGVADAPSVLAQARRSRGLGFTAKLGIHPDQIEPIRQAFAPTPAEVAWATKVLGGEASGVTVVDGQMVDRPVLLRARAVLRAATARTELGPVTD